MAPVSGLRGGHVCREGGVWASERGSARLEAKGRARARPRTGTEPRGGLSARQLQGPCVRGHTGHVWSPCSSARFALLKFSDTCVILRGPPAWAPHVGAVLAPPSGPPRCPGGPPTACPPHHGHTHRHADLHRERLTAAPGLPSALPPFRNRDSIVICHLCPDPRA